MSTPEAPTISLIPGGTTTVASSETVFSEASSEAALALGRSQGLDLSSLVGIPVLLPTQPGFEDAIRTWSVHHQPTEDDQVRAVFRPKTEVEVSRVVSWAREGGHKITPKSGGVGGACGRGGICLDMGAFNKSAQVSQKSVVARS
jgi:hypothetical protein